MSRRRYLSTDISRDKRVAQLCEQAGPVAMALYTWSIPHAADDGTIVSDPEEFLSEVAPNLVTRGQATIADAERCIEVGLELGLFASRSGGVLHFPESFYKHQTYIRGDRRGSPPPDPTPSNGAAQISANQRKSAQNVASLTSSFKSSSSTTAAPRGGGEAEALVEEFYETLGVPPHTLTTSLQRREVSIARQLVAAGARPGEARRFVGWCRGAPYRPVPSDLRVYENKRAQFLAGLEPVAASPPGRNGRVEKERRVIDHTGCEIGCTEDHRNEHARTA
jgi:hypothetical protein